MACASGVRRKKPYSCPVPEYERARLRRLVEAVLLNLDSWVEQGLEGIDGPDPKRALVHLTRNMMMARTSLRSLVNRIPDTER